eukprot:CAMPEP_0174333372 /NCGR_PEP_ID=MMETSP0810-20121108/19102_1 /TAXON_ID=73025 ORGANISM="Eutreptiella gymnastica-like, Strain CCMP1594" /NCGR_SAMPLE_ID=MMETSP0810 /ASSEMBLY_ACC=CAM_ASM_000659 /LENGTH=405 /DNA_ID=CAMNT_0015450455 /DNA_START=135 /DNA_END=1349 /DNA_ORIENTATION=+
MNYYVALVFSTLVLGIALALAIGHLIRDWIPSPSNPKAHALDLLFPGVVPISDFPAEDRASVQEPTASPVGSAKPAPLTPAAGRRCTGSTAELLPVNFTSTKLQFSHSFAQCSANAALQFDPSALALLVLDVGLSSSLIASIQTWQRHGLLKYVRSLNLFVNRMMPGDCQLVCRSGIRLFGSPNNIGLGAALDFLIQQAESEYVLFLEKDWQMDARLATVRNAHLLLQTNASTGYVLLSNTSAKFNDVWCDNATALSDAVNSMAPFRRQKAKAFGACTRFYAKQLFRPQFLNARNAAFQCPVDVVAGVLEPCLRHEHRRNASLWCSPAHLFPWTNNPFMASRTWLQHHLLPFIKRCNKGVPRCLYMGVESSVGLQCHVRTCGGSRAVARPSVFFHVDLDADTRDR